MSASSPATAAWKLSELLHGLVHVGAADDRVVSGLGLDSRALQAGDLFFAVPGVKSHGRSYAEQAVSRGAVAVVHEAGDDEPLPGLSVPVFGIKDLRQHIGFIADRFYGSPSRELFVIGITGTNGKTTCTQLLARILDKPSARCALIGTLGSGFPDALESAEHTTPDAVTVHRLLAGFLEAGAACVCMEVSSHALVQHRVAGVAFDVAVFTNLSRDHLDYHGDMAAYASAKSLLFAVESLCYVVINRDDEFGRELLAAIDARGKAGDGAPKALSYGVDGGDVRALAVRALRDGLFLDAATPQGEVHFHSRLFGRFNASNLLAVLAAWLACGRDLDEAVQHLSRVRPVAGRMECFGGGQGLPLVVVDYAHTPDALEKALAALREHTGGRLWCVFGCGGDRDRGKRPLMGRIAESLADRVIVTDDNPRHESPDQIVEEIVAGMRVRPKIIRDRIEAIRIALSEAGHDDTVLVAGKGHEQYQQVGDERLPYSDRRTVSELLEEAA